MNLVRWDPFGDFDSLFDRMMPSAYARRRLLSPSGDGGALTEWAPSADISETENEYLIRADLPAVKKEDVQVTVEGDVITVSGERKQQKEDKDEKSIRVEGFYGAFSRSFRLPDNVVADDIRCESKDGILTVHLPKSKEEKPEPRKIEVQ